MTDRSSAGENPSGSIGSLRSSYEEGRGLRGFRSACGFVTATWGLACPRCGQRDLTEIELAPTGAIVAVTVQHVPGDEFLNEAPYGYVVVELDGGGRATGWIERSSFGPREPQVGDRVHWVANYKPGVHFVPIAGSDPGPG